MGRQRQRIVQGSCWPCKQRRIKCDLGKPACRRCSLSGASCSYSRVFLRWSGRPTRKVPSTYQLCGNASLGTSHSCDSLNPSEIMSLEYFTHVLWPLFSASLKPCPPPTHLAKESQSIRLVIFEMAEAHRFNRYRWKSDGEYISSQCRVHCLSAVRRELQQVGTKKESLRPLLVAVLLLWFLDGFIESDRQSVSTASHQAGAQAILQHLNGESGEGRGVGEGPRGGVSDLLDAGGEDVNMLLSLFISNDLTRALLDGSAPYFPADIWLRIEQSTVWWEILPHTGVSLASILHIFSRMALCYSQCALARSDNRSRISPEADSHIMQTVREFEKSLQPTFSVLSSDSQPLGMKAAGDEDSEALSLASISQPVQLQQLSFIRIFQHTALVYLYRAICKLPHNHFLVQQHVQTGLESIRGMDSHCKVHNCLAFPLLVLGAHTLDPKLQELVVRRLDAIDENLHFGSIKLLQSALKQGWALADPIMDWISMFSLISKNALVL